MKNANDQEWLFFTQIFEYKSYIFIYISKFCRTVCCLLHCDSVIYYILGWAIKIILNAASITEIEGPFQVMPTTTPTPGLPKVKIHSCLFVVPLESDLTVCECVGPFWLKGIYCFEFILCLQPDHFQGTPYNPWKIISSDHQYFIRRVYWLFLLLGHFWFK